MGGCSQNYQEVVAKKGNRLQLKALSRGGGLTGECSYANHEAGRAIQRMKIK